MDDPSDEDLARSYARGETAALEMLVNRYSISAVRFAAHFARDHHAAEDLAQDVFVKLVNVLRNGGFDPARGRFAPFFFRMIRNLAIDRMRARGDDARLDVEIVACGDDNVSVALERAERSAWVRDVICKLPQSERAAISLREFDGLSYKEIAQTMDAPVDSVKTWIFRARRKIEEAWLDAGMLGMEAKHDNL